MIVVVLHCFGFDLERFDEHLDVRSDVNDNAQQAGRTGGGVQQYAFSAAINQLSQLYWDDSAYASEFHVISRIRSLHQLQYII